MKGEHCDDVTANCDDSCNVSNSDREPQPWLSSEEELDDEESSVSTLSSTGSSESEFGGFSVEDGGVPLQSADAGDTWAQCFRCSEIFGSQMECLQHFATCGGAALKCFQCEFKTRDKDALERHHEEKHAENVVQKDVKKRGRKPGKKIVRYPCPKCERTFKYDSLLNYHLRKECGRPPRFDCSLCGYRCNQKSKMRMHQEKVHNQLSASFVQLQRPAFIAAAAAAAAGDGDEEVKQVIPPVEKSYSPQEQPTDVKCAEVDNINNNIRSSNCPSSPTPISE